MAAKGQFGNTIGDVYGRKGPLLKGAQNALGALMRGKPVAPSKPVAKTPEQYAAEEANTTAQWRKRGLKQAEIDAGIATMRKSRGAR